MWKCHGTSRFVVALSVLKWMNELWHGFMGHVACDWVMLHVIESCCMWLSHVIWDWVMSHVIESCHRHVCGGATRCVWALWGPFQCFGEGGYGSQVKAREDARQEARAFFTHNFYLFNDSFSKIFVIWLNSICDIIHSSLWNYLLRFCDKTHSYLRHDSFRFAAWLVHRLFFYNICDMT